jgi:hypothetical protein
MPGPDGKFEISSIFFGAFVGFWGGVILGFGGCFVQVGSMGGSLSSGWSTFVFVLILCTAVGAVWFGIKEGLNVQKEREARERAIAQAERRHREEREAAREAARRSLQTRVTQNAREAATRFLSLPNLLGAVEEQRDRAKDHYANGAFSPFWECVEAAYGILGTYKRALDDIARISRQYAVDVSSYVREYGAPTPPFSEFPVTVDDARAGAAAESLQASLAQIVYEAQKQPTFAMIWEQRRNTSVLIAGFTTLAAAVNGMKQTLSLAISGLESTIESSSTEVSSSVASLTAAHGGLGKELLTQVSQATTRLNEISALEKRAQGYPILY